MEPCPDCLSLVERVKVWHRQYFASSCLHDLKSLVAPHRALERVSTFHQNPEGEAILHRCAICSNFWTIHRWTAINDVNIEPADQAVIQRFGSPATVADVEGLWIGSTFRSGLIERCKRGWNTPVGELTNELLATYIRQKIALSLVVPEARKRLATGHVDDSEQYDQELASAVKSVASGTA